VSTTYLVEGPSRVPTTAAELRPLLAAKGVDLDHVVSLEVVIVFDGTTSGDVALWVKATTYARDPLGQRFELLERDAAPRFATEVRLFLLEDLLG